MPFVRTGKEGGRQPAFLYYKIFRSERTTPDAPAASSSLENKKVVLLSDFGPDYEHTGFIFARHLLEAAPAPLELCVIHYRQSGFSVDDDLSLIPPPTQTSTCRSSSSPRGGRSRNNVTQHDESWWATWTVDGFARDVLEVLVFGCQWPEFHLVGLGFGSLVAQRLARYICCRHTCGGSFSDQELTWRDGKQVAIALKVASLSLLGNMEPGTPWGGRLRGMLEVFGAGTSSSRPSNSNPKEPRLLDEELPLPEVAAAGLKTIDSRTPASLACNETIRSRLLAQLEKAGVLGRSSTSTSAFGALQNKVNQVKATLFSRPLADADLQRIRAAVPLIVVVARGSVGSAAKLAAGPLDPDCFLRVREGAGEEEKGERACAVWLLERIFRSEIGPGPPYVGKRGNRAVAVRATRARL